MLPFLIQTTKSYQRILMIIKSNQPSLNSSCHFKSTVNHLRSTSTYTSYFLLLFYVTKYYKSAVYAGGESVKSDQTYILKSFALTYQFESHYGKELQ